MRINRRDNLSCKRPPAAFTIVEIMIVIVIIGLLATLVVTQLAGRVDQARIVTARADLKELEQAVTLFKTDNGRYPTNAEGLTALVQQPPDVKNWPKHGYLKTKAIKKDPWGNDYVYLYPGNKGVFDIICYGADGRPGGEDENADITNNDTD